MHSVLIALSTLAVLGMLEGSSQAGKTTTVRITLSGAIQGSGTDPAAMVVTFTGLAEDNDSSYTGTYIANPDRVLRLMGTGRAGRTLTYYFCHNPEHNDGKIPCDIKDHDPADYKELIIRGGALAGTGQQLLAVFPVNSSWEIWRKPQPRLNDPPGGVLEASGQLAQSVTYQETPLR